MRQAKSRRSTESAAWSHRSWTVDDGFLLAGRVKTFRVLFSLVSPVEEERPQECEGKGKGAVQEESDIELDVEEGISDEGRVLRTARDPGRPMQEKVDRQHHSHTVPFLCPACVPGRAREGHHKRR